MNSARRVERKIDPVLLPLVCLLFLRVCHQAARRRSAATAVSRLPVITRWYNKDLNEQQKQAVVRVVAGDFAPAPYVIFGPPGKCDACGTLLLLMMMMLVAAAAATTKAVVLMGALHRLLCFVFASCGYVRHVVASRCPTLC